MGQHLAAEAAEPAGESLAHVAVTDQADGFAHDLLATVGFPVPLPGPHLLIGRDDIAQQGQQQAYRELPHRIAVAFGGVEQGDPLLLQEGKIRGAALDVLENEKLATLTPEQRLRFDYLAQAPQVVLTPHIGGWSHQSYVKINQVLTSKIKKLLGL
jgi:hypothetical protein